MFALTLRVLGVTLLDLTVNTGDDPAGDEPPRDLDGGTVLSAGYQSSGFTLPSTDD